VRIIGTLVPFCVIGNSKEFPITQKRAVVYHYSNMTALYFYAANTPITFLK